MATLVFDIGGTKTRAGLFDCSQSSLIRSVCGATPNHLDFPGSVVRGIVRASWSSLMHRLAGEIVEGPAVTEINIAFAGPIDPSGNVLAAPTIWGTRLTGHIG